MMLFSSSSKGRIAGVTALLLVAACATTTTTEPITVASTPPDGLYKIMGVTLHDGMAVSFAEPAILDRDADGNPIIVGQKETTYMGSPAKIRTTILVSDIETFWVIQEKVAVTDETGSAAGVIAGAVLLCLLVDNCSD